MQQLTLEQLYRQHAGRVLAALIARLGDFQLAEDALQDAWVEALQHWPQSGVPNSPAAWLLTVARRRAIDRLRRVGTQQACADDLKYARELEQAWQAPDDDIPDERLRLIFTCCHPTLKLEHQVALTLHTLCGLAVEAIARAFLVSPITMAQRLVRAKRKIRDAGIPYKVPQADVLAERLAAVSAVVYLTFNEGYQVTAGDNIMRPDLCAEAIRLGRLLAEQMPTPETAGLLALMLLHHARSPARMHGGTGYIPLDQQERSLWDQQRSSEGQQLLLRALAQGRPGPYQIQAAISAVHNEAADASQTDWRQIAGLYGALLEIEPSPVVALNRAIAVGRAESAVAALAIIEGLAEALADYQPFHAARAQCLAELGHHDDARASYRRAITMTTNAVEADYLHHQLAALS